MDDKLIPWSPNYELGISEIDDQHKILIDILNDLYNAFILKEHENVLNSIISRLFDYALVHFSVEEKYFDQFNYPDMASHKNEHQKFIEQLNSFKLEHYEKKAKITYSIINFLSKWITNHIMLADRKYVSHFIQNGVK